MGKQANIKSTSETKKITSSGLYPVGQPIVVTTEYRGIFFGYVKDSSNLPESIELTEVCNCLSWSSDMGGFVGLIAKGPSESCKIGPSAESMTLWKITSCAPVSTVVAANWALASIKS